MKIERLRSGRDFVDEKGNVRHVSDILPNMEPITGVGGSPAQHALSGLARVRREGTSNPRSGGRSDPEITGRDIGREIDNAQVAESERLGRPLTEDELQHVAHLAERRARGFQD